MIGLLSLAASVVPTIVGLFDEEAGDTTQKIVDAGMALTGASTEDEAVAALKARPELLAEFKTRVEEIELEKYREDTKRMGMVNETMRAEIAGRGLFKTGWRPAFGWIAALSFGLTIFCFMAFLGWTIFNSPKDMAGTINALSTAVSAMIPLWYVALAVLGVAVWKRSSDKEMALTGEKRTSGLMRVAKGLREAFSTKPPEGGNNNG